MDRISLLNWTKADEQNDFKVTGADCWELHPLIKEVNLLDKKITVSIDLYQSREAFEGGAKKLKSRVHRVDLSNVNGLLDLLLAEIKNGVQSLQEVDQYDIDTDTVISWKDGFFKDAL